MASLEIPTPTRVSDPAPSTFQALTPCNGKASLSIPRKNRSGLPEGLTVSTVDAVRRGKRPLEIPPPRRSRIRQASTCKALTPCCEETATSLPKAERSEAALTRRDQPELAEAGPDLL